MVSAFRISRERMRHAAAGLQRVLAREPRDVVEDLEVVLVRDQRLVAVRAEVPDVLEHHLGHRRRRLAEVDARDADRLGAGWCRSRSAS